MPAFGVAYTRVVDGLARWVINALHGMDYNSWKEWVKNGGAPNIWKERGKK